MAKSAKVIRSRPVVLFTATGIALHPQAKRGCIIDNAESVRTIDLDACRPDPIGAAEKAVARKMLPAQGAVRQLAADDRAKLDGVTRVLRLHGRDNVYDVIVIAVPQAWTGLHQRAVLLISLPALNLLKAEELQARSGFKQLLKGILV